MLKKNYLLPLLFLLSACATTGEGEFGKDKSKIGIGSTGEESTEKQDVRKLDLNYSKNFLLSKKRGKFDCKKHVEFKKEDWKKFVESALSCIYDKNWTELSKIADVFSHNHIKAPWGPYYKSIVASEQFKDYHRAEWMCNLALKKSPNNTVITYQLARIFWNTDRKPQAYDLMESIRKKGFNSPSVLRFLGDIEYKDRNFKKALKYYTKIKSKYYRDLDFRAALATSFFYTGKKEKSLNHYKYVAKNIVDKGLPLYQLGEVYKSMKNWSLAKAYYLKAMKAGPNARNIASLDLKIKVQIDYVDQRIKESKRRKK